MRRRSIVISCALVGLTFVVGLACSSQSHGPLLDGCPPGATCPISPGGGGTGTTTTTTTTTDTGTEAGALPLIDITGTVRGLQAFGDDPATDGANMQTGLVIRAIVNGSQVDTPVSAGTFSVSGVTQTPPLTWIELVSNGNTVQTIYGFATDGSALTAPLTLDVPLVPPELIQAAAVQFAADADGGAVQTDGRATVILQLLDAANSFVPVTNATALHSPGADGPFYDDGSNGLRDSTTGTSSRGTIVYLGADVANFGALSFTAKGSIGTFTPVLAPNAVTFLRLALP